MKRFRIPLLVVLLCLCTPAARADAPVQLRAAQACTYATAATRLHAVVYDRKHWPYGEVSAWSCTSAAEAQSEFARRIAEMQAAADAVQR